MPQLRKQNIVSLHDHIADKREKAVAKEKMEQQMVNSLQSYGLSDPEVDLIMSKYFDTWSNEDIAKDGGWVDGNAINYLLRKTLKKLKALGYRKGLK